VAPRVATASPARSDERVADDEYEENRQSGETRHGVDLRIARMFQRVFGMHIGQASPEL
jgi:hypothetical protein